ncbi:hypothetical protein RFI_06994, partial [Reticulomyxa filosa]
SDEDNSADPGDWTDGPQKLPKEDEEKIKKGREQRKKKRQHDPFMLPSDDENHDNQDGGDDHKPTTEEINKIPVKVDDGTLGADVRVERMGILPVKTGKRPKIPRVVKKGPKVLKDESEEIKEKQNAPDENDPLAMAIDWDKPIDESMPHLQPYKQYQRSYCTKIHERAETRNKAIKSFFFFFFLSFRLSLLNPFSGPSNYNKLFQPCKLMSAFKKTHLHLYLFVCLFVTKKPKRKGKGKEKEKTKGKGKGKEKGSKNADADPKSEKKEKSNEKKVSKSKITETTATTTAEPAVDDFLSLFAPTTTNDTKASAPATVAEGNGTADEQGKGAKKKSKKTKKEKAKENGTTEEADVFDPLAVLNDDNDKVQENKKSKDTKSSKSSKKSKHADKEDGKNEKSKKDPKKRKTGKSKTDK